MTTLSIEPRYTFQTRLQDEAIAEAEAREAAAFARQQLINKVCSGLQALHGMDSSEVVQVLSTLHCRMLEAKFCDTDLKNIEELIDSLDTLAPEVIRS